MNVTKFPGTDRYYASRIPATAERVFSGISYDIYQWPQDLYDGRTVTYEMAKAHDGVSVVAVKDDRIILLEQEQPNRPKYWSTPGGHIEPGETPLAAAQRELLEETGMEFSDWKLVRVEPVGNYRLEWYIFRFVASGFAASRAPSADSGERITVHELSLNEAKLRAQGNYFTSPPIITDAGAMDDILALPALPGNGE